MFSNWIFRIYFVIIACTLEFPKHKEQYFKSEFQIKEYSILNLIHYKTGIAHSNIT